MNEVKLTLFEFEVDIELWTGTKCFIKMNDDQQNKTLHSAVRPNNECFSISNDLHHNRQQIAGVTL